MAGDTEQSSEVDLMPPPFSEGLDDWSQGDGTPDMLTYERALNARLAREDPDFGVCLELRKIETVQRVRYMGEVPLLPGAYIEISAQVKAVRGPLPMVRIAAWPGGASGTGVSDLPTAVSPVALCEHGTVCVPRAVIGPEVRPGVDLVWDARALYTHVGLDLIGPDLGVVRIGGVFVRDVTRAFAASASVPKAL